MKFALILFALAVVAASASHDDEWKNFKAKHGRKYAPGEEAKRKALHKARADKINKHNSEHAQGRHAYKLGHNHMDDWTDEERKALIGEKDIPTDVNPPLGVIEQVEMRQSYPTNYNWNTSSCMQPVQDQGRCGDCYSFAATGVAEFLRCAATNSKVKLSEQALADCSTPQGNAKCNGGLAVWGFQWIMANGIPTSASYPYTSGATGLDGTCKYSPTSTTKKCVTMTGWGFTTTTWDESTILPAIYTRGPLAISIYASPDFMNYAGGVYTKTSDCPANETNHAVMAVGFGRDEALKLDYWVLRNSWSSYWGENGYARVIRGVGWCGIARRPTYAVIDATNPAC